jgi:hypothetical protein
MKNYILIPLLLLLNITSVFSQSFQWARDYGGTKSESAGSVFIDQYGNNYITGGFSSAPAYFDSYNISCSGTGNIFICKTNASGNVIWVKKAGSSDINYGMRWFYI